MLPFLYVTIFYIIQNLKLYCIDISLEECQKIKSVEILQNLGLKFSQGKVGKAVRKEGAYKGMRICFQTLNYMLLIELEIPKF